MMPHASKGVTMAQISVHRSNPGEDLARLVAEYNNLVAKFTALLAKLDADAGVTDTNYASLLGQVNTINLVS